MYGRFSLMRLLPLTAVAATLLAVGCKTNENNYRQAYETAVAKNRDASGVDSTIYTRMRNNVRTSDLVAGTDTMRMRTEHVGYTEDGGASRDMLKRYNVVVGQFKQVFNARQMRARLQASGYSGAFIIHTREPLYYVCTATCATPEEALAEFGRVKADGSVVLRDPLPFILRPAHMAR